MYLRSSRHAPCLTRPISSQLGVETEGEGEEITVVLAVLAVVASSMCLVILVVLVVLSHKPLLFAKQPSQAKAPRPPLLISGGGTHGRPGMGGTYLDAEARVGSLSLMTRSGAGGRAWM